MNISDVPKKQPVPFGVNGQREDLLSTTPAGDNQASYDAGFPPITMILKSAGGLPPKGQDMNQILYELAAIARWAGAGANYPFDSTFATAIGGYPAGAKVLASDNAGFWLNETDANSTNPEAADYTLTGWVPSGHTGTTAITGLAASDVTLSSLQAAKDVITLAGTLTANINLILPAWIKQWKIINNCTGAFTVTVKTNAGTGIAVSVSTSMDLRGDGTDIVDANASVKLTGTPTAPTAAKGTSTTQLATTEFVAKRIPNFQIFTAGGTWTCPDGITTVYLSGGGAGGGGAGGNGGAGSTASSACGGGGGAGQSVIRYPVTVVPGTAYTITIGTAGTHGSGGTNGNLGSNGSNGGDTSFGALLTLTGGERGSASGSLTGAGGNGGSYGGTDGDGGSSSLIIYPTGGNGGSSPFGTAGGGKRNANSSINAAGSPGFGYCAGGGGGGGITNISSGQGAPGTDGLPGILILEW